MIFVSLGTQDKAFKRLLEIIDNSNINDKIIVQSGYTDFNSEKMEIIKYLNKNEFTNYLKEADIIITHGGVGTIMEALSLNKIIIACPRLAKYKEHQNDHQIEIVNTLANEGYILALNENDDLNEIYNKALTFKPKEFKRNNDTFIQRLSTYLDI